MNAIARDARASSRILAVVSALVAALLLWPAAASAQFSDGYKFLEAVKKSDGTTVMSMLSDPSSTLVNARDITSGETGLHVTIARNDATWTRFLLQKGANPNLADKDGVTPLQNAVGLNFVDGAEALLEHGANPNTTNSIGETPLITAVLADRPAMVKLLLENGANPDRADRSGRSARDYASLSRQPRMLALIEDSDNAGPVEQYGPVAP